MVGWTVALAVGLCTGTGPAVFATDPVAAFADGALVCRMINRAPAGRRVRIEALDESGVAATDSGTFILEPGASYVSGGGLEARRCRFTVVGEVSGVGAHGLVISRGQGVLSLAPRPVRADEVRRHRPGARPTATGPGRSSGTRGTLRPLPGSG